MSTRPNDGGPAFPHPAIRDNFDHVELVASTGMSLRDWFAGQALAGLVANPEGRRSFTAADWSQASYECADAMLAARQPKDSHEA